MTKAQLLALRNRLFLHDEIPEQDLDADLPPYYRPAPDEKAARYLAERRRALGGPLPSRVDRSRPLPPPAQGGVRRSSCRFGTPGGVHHHGLRPAAAVAGPRSGHRAAHRPHRVRRSPHLRARIPDQRSADLRPRGPALHPGGRRPGPPLCRERHRPGAGGGDQRSRRGGRLHRGGDLLRHLGRADDPLLPLLLDVRLPAGR